MQGFGVNTYKWVNAAGETVLVKYHWLPKQGVTSLTAAEAAAVQAPDARARTPRTSTTPSSAATSRSGSCTSS